MNIELDEDEKAELIRFKQYFPFRAWFAVKSSTTKARCFDSKRKASNYAKKNAPCAIFAAQ